MMPVPTRLPKITPKLFEIITEIMKIKKAATTDAKTSPRFLLPFSLWRIIWAASFGVLYS